MTTSTSHAQIESLLTTAKASAASAVDPSKLTRIFSSPEDISHKVDKVLIAGLSAQFPVENKDYRLEAENFRAERKEFSQDDEKQAILESRSLTYPIRATLKLIDKNTGKVIDQLDNFSLMDSFHLTGKHTMVYKGNNYTVANQLQLRPGVYTRTRETGELESHFNTGTGQNFHMLMDPQSKLFSITPRGSSSEIALAPIITTVFNIQPSEVAKYIPAELWAINLKDTAGKEAKTIKAAYQKFVSTSKQKPGATIQEMAEQLKTSLESSELNEQTTHATLGKGFKTIQAETLLRAMKNLFDTHIQERPEDNRDSLQFKRVQNLPDFLRTRFAKQHQVVNLIKNRMVRELDKVSLKEPMPLKAALSPKPFNKFFSTYIQSSNLANTPSETNPIESVENVAKVTVLGKGEGGIGDEQGVPMGARDIDPSHLGLIDPSRTPESSHAGIDQRFTVNARRDDDGNLYARVRDHSGKVKYLSVHTMMNSVIGFPPIATKGDVQAQVKGRLGKIDASKVDYWLADNTDIYTITTNLVPFLNSNSPGRLTMAGKAIPQALSLVNREVPLVQTTTSGGKSFVKQLAGVTGTVATVAGTVTKADSTSVTIKTDQGKQVTIKAVKNLPFNMKGFHDDEHPLVKVGDKVEENQLLFENNYTKDGVFSLGKNLEVAYIPWKGYNHEDGLVISKSTADSLSSHPAYKVDYEINTLTTAKKSALTRWFPSKFTRAQLANLDERGFAKVGAVVKKGDPVYAVLERRDPTPEDKILGRLHKSMVTPFRVMTEEWHHDEPGTVVDAHTSTRQVRFIIRSVKPLEIGDKLTGLHGNKGIVSLIMDDHKMPYSQATGKPVDILLNPASVTSRVNLGQLMETAAGKIAKITGKPYLVHNFESHDSIGKLRDELHKLVHSDSETLVDPATGGKLVNVLTGPQYFLKLYKTSDQNWSARSVGGYDNSLQPVKGGEEGSKSIGYMEMLGLLGSNARKNLKEISTIKSQLNTEYWDKFVTGQALPKPKTTFATEKFLNYLTASGIKTTLRDGMMTASPMTDKDILHISNGETLTAALIRAKDMTPERKGLFDPIVTGGVRGTKWSHYKLPEPIVNPIAENSVRALTGLTTKEYDGIAHGKILVKKTTQGFDLHDVHSKNKIRSLKVNAVAGRELLEDAEENEADDNIFEKP